MKTLVCSGIAYDWLLEPPCPGGHDFTLVIATCQAVLGSKSTPAVDHRIYHAKFRPPGQPFQLIDVSGTLGLLWQTTERAAQEKADTFERMLADALVWTLGDLAFPDSSEHIVLVQGPLIPKLRGRHLYRGIDPRVPIYYVTFQMDWFRRMEAAQTTFVRLPMSHTSQVADVYPPKAIDRATRSWVCRLPGERDPGEPVHFEVIANMLDYGAQTPGESWLDERKKEIERLTTTANLETISTDQDTRLPGALALAVREVGKWKQFEDKFSRVFRLSEERLSVKGAVDRRSDEEPLRVLFGPGFCENIVDVGAQGELLAAATTGSAQLNCNASYEHLRSKWEHAEVRKAVDRLLSQRRHRT